MPSIRPVDIAAMRPSDLLNAVVLFDSMYEPRDQ